MASKVAFIVFACLTATVASSRPHGVRLHTGEQYNNYQETFDVNGKCQKVRKTLYRNTGSFDIPCGGDFENETGQKTACTLYSDQACKDELVQFDRPHSFMFSRPRSESGTEYVGGLLGGIKCELVDVNTPISNSNGHPSTSSQSGCRNGDYQPPGKSPEDDLFEGASGFGR